jgi:acetyl esterase
MLTQQAPLHYDPSASYEVSWQDVEYLNDGQQSWLARVYQPKGSGPFPLLLEIHGGAWTQNDRTQNQPLDEALAASGLVVAAIDFHLGGQAPHPAAQADINYATRWLKAHAAKFNASAAGLGGIGFSSGGHQIMLAAMRPDDPRYALHVLKEDPNLDASLAYVIMGWPVIDPYARWTYSRDLGRQHLVDAGLLYFGDEATMQEANPQLMLERGESAILPPALFVHGSADDVVPPTTAEDFVAVYARAGGVIELAKYPGAAHGFMRDPSRNTDLALEAMKYFIARQVGRMDGS